MLDRLPTELLLAIIELTLPPEDAYSGYDERQHTLYNYCLVNCQLSAVAQPVFQRAVHLEEEDGILCKFRLSGSPTVFTNLTSLALHNMNTYLPISPTLLNPASFPNLRALYTNATVPIPSSGGRRILRTLPTLHNQLDMLQVHFRHSLCFPSDLFASNVPVLLSFELKDVVHLFRLCSEAPVQHLQLNTPWLPPRATDLYHLKWLVWVIDTSPLLLTLSLPARLHPSSPGLSPAAVRHRDEVLSAVEDHHSLRLIWRLHAFMPEDDLSVSGEFWSYAKELKAKEAAKAGEK
ncbi:hypothetical protein JCM6882_004457 [Rhodosporidiobolus microsporus]